MTQITDGFVHTIEIPDFQPTNINMKDKLGADVFIPHRAIDYVRIGYYNQTKGYSIRVVLHSGEWITGYVDDFGLEQARRVQ